MYHVYTSACFSPEESSFGLVSLVSVKNLGRISFSSVLVRGLRSSIESFIDFLKAGILVLQATGLQVHCVSRIYNCLKHFCRYIICLTKLSETLLSMHGVYCFRKNEIKHALIFVYAV